MTIYSRTNATGSDFRNLVSLLDADLSIRDGEDHDFYDQFNKIDNIHHVIVCYHNSMPVGCGALKRFDSNKVEIKRMFVKFDAREQGFAQAILQALELWAIELQYSECILETGKKQPEAINLYKKAGYQKIDNYGQYENVENSICMTKALFNK